MHPNSSSKPTQPELLGLESFLRSRSSGDSAMNLSRTHGCLAAIVSGPKQFEAGEWIRLIFDKPVFDDYEELCASLISLLSGMHTNDQAH